MGKVWAPIAFDGNQQVSSGAYDFVSFKIRSSIPDPPLKVISARGVTCSFGDFAQLDSGIWTQVQIPLASLGYAGSENLGRIKLKSSVSYPFTVWITGVTLAAISSAEPPLPPEPPENRGPPTEPPMPEVPPSTSRGDQLINWNRDPGVAGSIDDHIPHSIVAVQANGTDGLDDSAAFLAALESISDGGIVEVPAGIYYLSVPLELTRNRQILRGAGADRTHLVFTQSLPYGIAVTGQYPGTKIGLLEASYLSNTMRVSKTTAFTPGSFAVITDQNYPDTQTVKILDQQQFDGYTRLTLEEPLNSHYYTSATIQAFDATEFSGAENLTLDIASDSVLLNDMVYFRSAANSWLRNVVSKRARQSHVFTRQTNHCEISGSTFDDATGHGDGKQGYGVDLANSTTGCLVENNILKHLRHSILFNTGANGNVVAFNYSLMPRHTNFANGGPGDISFHAYSHANLVEGNVVERIHIGDAGSVGKGNLIHRNCLTSGPLTLQNTPTSTQFIFGNAMYGSDQQLRETIMPPVYPESPSPRPYLNASDTLFDEDGVTVFSDAAVPIAGNNWHAEQRWNPSDLARSSYYGSTFPVILDQRHLSGNWRIDCSIPAVIRAGF